MTVIRYPELLPGEDHRIETEGREHFLLREVHYHPSGEIQLDVEFDENGDEIERFENEIGENGKITEHRHLSGDVLLEKTTLEYNEAGKVTVEMRHYEESEPSYTYYTYDEKGRMTEKRVEPSPGEIEHADRYAYLPGGDEDHITLQEEYGTDNELLKRMTVTYDTAEGKPSKTEMTSENFETGNKYRVVYYDARTHEDHVALVIYDTDGKISDIMREWYDENGNMVRQALKTRTPAADYSEESEYDGENRLIYRHILMGNGDFRTSYYGFNENKQPAWTTNNAGHSRDISNMLFTDVFSYEYYS